jgi:asparagine synthase (glutamine-hydrolysing)
MCGIVGIHGPQEPRWIEDLSAATVHRGPDDDGLFRDAAAGLSLAIRRLAIIDIGGGVQPMRSPDGRYAIVYNGEIYNARELRQELEAAGERFTTDHSDTEVLLRLLMREREACLGRLNGMFAFAFYDAVERTILCARDRIGIKPLYYVQSGSRFAFASELKALLRLPFVDRDIDRQSLFDYFSLFYVPGERSILKSVRRLLPGHWLKYSLADGAIRIAPWWRLEYEPDTATAAGEWPARIRDELERAVRRWSVSDVPVAVSLSGGLDSSAVAAIAARAGVEVSAYSLGFQGPGEESWDELPLAREVARKWGLKHHEIVLRPEAVLDALPAMVVALDEPYAGGLPSWFVFERIGRDVKVALTGTGGDELFGNYGKWRSMEGRGFLGRLFGVRMPVDRQRFRRNFFDAYYYFPDAEKRAVLADGGADCRDTADVLYERFAAIGAADVRDAIAGLDIGTQLPDEFLLMTDRFSMAHSVEARTPFLDHGFVDLVRRIPARLRTRRNDLKYLLREAVAPLLPPALLSAPKRGFVIPFGLWLRGPLRSLVEDVLAPSALRRQNLLSPDFHDRYVRPHLAGTADHTSKIWAAIMFQLWYGRFIANAAYLPAAPGRPASVIA